MLSLRCWYSLPRSQYVSRSTSALSSHQENRVLQLAHFRTNSQVTKHCSRIKVGHANPFWLKTKLLQFSHDTCRSIYTSIPLGSKETDKEYPDVRKVSIPSSTAARIKEAVIKKVMQTSKKKAPESAVVSTERNFITPLRAMAEYLLTSEVIKGMKKTRRRSAYDDDRITVLWTKEVKQKAVETWGSLENIEKERVRRKAIEERHYHSMSNIRRILKDLNYEEPIAFTNLHEEVKPEKTKAVPDAATRVVYYAIAINGLNFIVKAGAWYFTGAHCLSAEALHSLADTTNQCVLAYGIHKSNKSPDSKHPYGYGNMRHMTSLLSGAMIFFVGGGLSLTNGITGLLNPHEQVESMFWAITILGGSLLSELTTLVMAINATRQGALRTNQSFMEYVVKGVDPSVNVVLMEDTAAVVGVGVALTCLGLTSWLSSSVPDALGSCLIGGILASVSCCIIYTNVAPLVGRSVSQRDMESMNRVLEQDPLVRSVHDVKCIDLGKGMVRYKAEVDIDGRQMAEAFLAKQNRAEIIRQFQTARPDQIYPLLTDLLADSGDSLGEEFDRLEKKLKDKHPEVRHCDLEVL